MPDNEQLIALGISPSAAFDEETRKLNDLMEEAFGVRPMAFAMPMADAEAWKTKLLIHWIEEVKKVIKP